MKRRDFIASAAAATGLAGCGVFTAHHTLRYRLTLTINAVGKLRTGSTVLETTWVDRLNLGQGSRWSGKTWGDAIVVMRYGESALVGMLGLIPGYEGGFTLPYDWLDFLLSPSDRDLPDESRFEAVSSLTGEHPLPILQWPLMTYIGDVGKLASARLVCKETPDERFSIQSFSLAVTKDPVDRGIGKTLPCLQQVGTYQPGFVPLQQIPAYQLFRKKNFSAGGDGI